MTLNVNDAFLCLYDKRAPQAPIPVSYKDKNNL